jgi:hypothetical protein
VHVIFERIGKLDGQILYDDSNVKDLKNIRKRDKHLDRYTGRNTSLRVSNDILLASMKYIIPLTTLSLVSLG